MNRNTEDIDVQTLLLARQAVRDAIEYGRTIIDGSFATIDARGQWIVAGYTNPRTYFPDVMPLTASHHVARYVQSAPSFSWGKTFLVTHEDNGIRIEMARVTPDDVEAFRVARKHVQASVIAPNGDRLPVTYDMADSEREPLVAVKVGEKFVTAGPTTERGSVELIAPAPERIREEGYTHIGEMVNDELGIRYHGHYYAVAYRKG